MTTSASAPMWLSSWNSSWWTRRMIAKANLAAPSAQGRASQSAIPRSITLASMTASTLCCARLSAAATPKAWMLKAPCVNSAAGSLRSIYATPSAPRRWSTKPWPSCARSNVWPAVRDSAPPLCPNLSTGTRAMACISMPVWWIRMATISSRARRLLRP